MRYYWTCPHCKHDNSGFITMPALVRAAAHQTSGIARCDVEEGGCDRRVVVDVVVATNATVYVIEEV